MARSLRGGALWIAALGLALSARAGNEIGPGAYCPLPKKGEVPKCLSPAKDAYGEFFSAVEEESGDEEALSEVEAAVARGAQEQQAYLALSSLTYGYYRLAQRAAAAEHEDPVITQRLARWNDLLAGAYSGSPDDAEYRAAVRRAAEELSHRAPVRVPCLDAAGEVADCQSTENVLRGFNAATEEAGIRGALERLLERVFGGGDA